MKQLTFESLDSIRRVAQEWSQGVVVLNPFEEGDLVIIAVTNFVAYNPANNIHHTTIQGKDIRLLVEQRLSVPGYTGKNPAFTFINNIAREEVWEVSHNERWYWIKMKDA